MCVVGGWAGGGHGLKVDLRLLSYNSGSVAVLVVLATYTIFSLKVDYTKVVEVYGI